MCLHVMADRNGSQIYFLSNELESEIACVSVYYQLSKPLFKFFFKARIVYIMISLVFVASCLGSPDLQNFSSMSQKNKKLRLWKLCLQHDTASFTNYTEFTFSKAGGEAHIVI